uniref:Uncharacterized protein n=1 Tax=Arundo donax TaxID=35708 RepID=A0A0A8YD92_ARUDO
MNMFCMASISLILLSPVADPLTISMIITFPPVFLSGMASLQR